MTDEDPIGGCAHCGICERDHAQRHTIAAGWHKWEAPDPDLLRRRMWYRRITRAAQRSVRAREGAR